jgi:hypothetical protein
MVIGWFSCGITSSVACKLALQMYDDVRLYYTDTGSQDDDSMRFLHDCEKWYGCDIQIVKNEKFENHFDVIQKRKFINSSNGAACTKLLKKDMRYKIEDELGCWDGQIWGFDISELLRAKRMAEQNPCTKPLYPLIDSMLSKENCAEILLRKGIELPNMYKLGYRNNNCIGCVKGGMGYWNKIRVDFPDAFDRMAKLERLIGHSCLKEEVNDKTILLFLDELEPNRGDFPAEIMPECGLFCELEFMNK